MRQVPIAIYVALTLVACGGEATSADPAVVAIDELIDAYNAHDADAIRTMFDSDFVFNTPSGVEIPVDEFADRVAEEGLLVLERVDEGTRNDDGTITFVVEATNPNSLYPATYTWQVASREGKIVAINERRSSG